MQDLIKIFTHSIGGHKVNAVNARDVWETLGVGRDYSNWIKDRLEIYDEGFDYIRILSISENNLNLNKNGEVKEVISLGVFDTENLNCVVLDKDKKFPGKKYESMLRAKTIDDEIKELENIKQKLKDEGYYHK